MRRRECIGARRQQLAGNSGRAQERRNYREGGYPMRYLRRSMMVSAVAATALMSAAAAQLATPADPGFGAVEAQESTANGKAGPRHVPGRIIPVPDTVSPQLQDVIAGPYRVPAWNADPKSVAEWK